jgi:hypothetical protein
VGAGGKRFSPGTILHLEGQVLLGRGFGGGNAAGGEDGDEEEEDYNGVGVSQNVEQPVGGLGPDPVSVGGIDGEMHGWILPRGRVEGGLWWQGGSR